METFLFKQRPRAVTGRGFTLAEVLITLGIIGVVAALTMPALIANHRKKVVVTRLQKFYSVFNQAINTKIAEDGAIDCSMIEAPNNPDEILNFFNINYAPYLKTIKVEKTTKGVAAGFPDGSGIYIYKNVAGADCANTRVVFCVDYPKCRDINDTGSSDLDNGKDTFRVAWTGKYATNYTGEGSIISFDRETLKTKCAGSEKRWCLSLIMLDGWEIREDYPIKF